jgi:hypothetical protein
MPADDFGGCGFHYFHIDLTLDQHGALRLIGRAAIRLLQQPDMGLLWG